MTSFGAYDRDKPCENPHCKSYGKPHPNCECYIGLADGGAVDALPDASTLTPVTDAEALPDASTLTPVEGEEQEALPDASTLIPTEDYESFGQEALTGAEGALHGILPIGAAAAEDLLAKTGISALSAEEQAKRHAVNPGIYETGKVAGLVGSLMTGAGEVPAVAKLVETGLEGANLLRAGSLGSKLISGAITNGVIAGGDELSKAMLGQGDPEHAVGAAVANIGGSALLGVAGSGIGEALNAAKLGTRLTSFLGGFGSASSPAAELKAIDMLTKDGLVNQRAYDYGQKAYQILSGPTAGAIIGGGIGYQHGGAEGALEGAVMGGMFGGAEHRFKLAGSTLIKIMSAAPLEANIGSIARDALDHSLNVERGMGKVNKLLDGVFKAGAQQTITDWQNPAMRRKLQEYIGEGGYNQNVNEEMNDLNQAPQGFAKGGEVKSFQPVKKEVKSVSEMAGNLAKVYPEQDMLMNAARGRVSNYLQSLQPAKNQPRLAFDDEPDTHKQQKIYDRATDIAVNPLGIVHEIKNGTIDAEGLQHFKAMYPEIDKVLAKGIADRITQMQVDGKEKPPAHIRDGLAMLIGAPLSGEQKPQNIQAAQQALQLTAAANQAQNQPAQGKPAKNTKAPLAKTSQSLQTTQQSLISRQQRSS